ncbi:MAG TPA: [Fe-S]-binding protein, partial [Chthoniobacteraceae bacterium]
MTAQEKFQRDSERTSADAPRRAFVRNALRGYAVKRDELEDRYVDWEAAREAASATKFEAV